MRVQKSHHTELCPRTGFYIHKLEERNHSLYAADMCDGGSFWNGHKATSSSKSGSGLVGLPSVVGKHFTITLKNTLVLMVKHLINPQIKLRD